MPVLMMNVGHMRMAVGDRLMGMRVGVGLAAIPGKIMAVLVVGVVHMRMCVLHCRVRMRVRVCFSQV